MSERREAILKQFARAVRFYRYQKAWTQEDLAEKSGFHVNYIGGIERAKFNPSLESIVVLARALGISPKDLVPL
jgi:transcriptional regulator with XRE-family HTH domain